MGKKRVLKALRTILSFSVAAFMINLVVEMNDVNPRQLWLEVDGALVLLAFLAYGFGTVLAAFRWKLLLNYVNVPLTYLTVLRLTFIGLFFNLFVPGGVGGDLIKMFYLRREAGDNFAEAVLTVLLDRLLGLAGLLLLAITGLVWNTELLDSSTKEMKGMLIAVGIASAAGLLGGLAFFCWPLLGSIGQSWQEGLSRRLPEKLNDVFQRVGRALNLLRKAPLMLAQLLGLAMVGHLGASVAVMFIGWSFEGGKLLGFKVYLLATQLSNLVAAVPLTPGGVGGRDLAMAFLLRAAGASENLAGSLPLTVTAVLITWSAIGGLALLWERKTGVALESQA